MLCVKGSICYVSKSCCFRMLRIKDLTHFVNIFINALKVLLFLYVTCQRFNLFYKYFYKYSKVLWSRVLHVKGLTCFVNIFINVLKVLHFFLLNQTGYETHIDKIF